MGSRGHSGRSHLAAQQRRPRAGMKNVVVGEAATNVLCVMQGKSVRKSCDGILVADPLATLEIIARGHDESVACHRGG